MRERHQTKNKVIACQQRTTIEIFTIGERTVAIPNVAVVVKTTALSMAILAPQICWSASEILIASKHDDYTKSTGIATQNYVLPGEDIGSSFWHATTAYALLMGNVTDAGQESMSLRVVYTDPNGWAFLSVTHDSEGVVLPLDVISHEVESGSRISEEISIRLPRGYLASHVKTGLNIRVDGKKGQIFVKLPANYVEGFVKQLEVAEANVRSQLAPLARAASGRPKLGVGFLPVDATNAHLVGLSSPKGVIVARIEPDSLAEKSGLKAGDVILSANGQPVPSTLTGLPSLVAVFPLGSTIDFTIWRANAESHVSVQF
jgi:hypothetical protein